MAARPFLASRNLFLPLALVLAAAPPAAAQALELHSLKTRLQHELRLRAWARRPVEVDWTAASALDVARDLTRALGLPIHPSELVRERVATRDLPLVDLRSKHAPALGAMELVAARTGLLFVDHGRTLRLVLPEEFQPEATLRLYSVHALTFVLRDFAPPIGFDLRGSNEEVPVEELETRTVSGFDEPGLADLVKRLLGPAHWTRDDVSIDTGRGVLVIRQTPRAHMQIERLLRDLGA
ncbi:MAG: hypothetical protein IPN34_07635 [Planctomycetes bacterium]|nr:hypothetical protein [Planctomycetota bacterium]